MVDTNDIGIKHIATFLKSLTKLISSQISKAVLDIHKHEAISKELIRLERSLDQYVTRKADLFYIGLMGHFSTGKSTTINSLLTLAESQHARETGVNPTDRHVTLITHPKNTASLIALNRESRVPIRTYPIEHELLETVVLADTPGAGDPSLMSDLMRDFLPVCDLILYFFSAASPLDTADMPVLEQMHQHLPFLPKQFVVTRADEFRKDKQQCLSAGNFDHTCADLEIGKLITRMKELMPDFSLQPSDYVLIDNIAGYGIQRLADHIVEQSKIASTADRVNMHLHKQAYFKSRAIAIRDDLLAVAQEKVSTMMRFVATAKENIDKYQEKVLITNNKLTGSWLAFTEQLTQTKDEVLSQLPGPLGDEDVPPTIWEHDRVADWRSVYAAEATAGAHAAVNAWVETLERSVRGYVGNWIGQSRKLLNSADPLQSQLHNQFADTPITVDPRVAFEFGSPKDNTTPAYALFGRMSTATAMVGERVVDRARPLLRLSEAAKPLPSYDHIHEEARENICADIDTFFETVGIYRTAMFALQVKEYIASLRIGRRLDEIERDLDAGFCESIKTDATSRLFPDQVAARNTFTATARHVIEETKRVMGEARPPSAMRAGAMANDGALEHSQLTKIAEQVKDTYAGAIQQTLRDCANNLARRISAAQDEMASRKRELVKRRGSIAIRVAALVTTFGVLGYLLLRWEWVVDRNTVGPTLGIGVLANAIFFAMSWCLGRLAYRYKSRELRSRRAIVSGVRNDCENLLESAMASIDTADVDTSRLVNAIIERANAVLDAASSSETVRAYEAAHVKIKKGAGTLAACVKAYGEGIVAVYDSYRQPFADHGRNLQILAEISGRIRKRAIEPSFSTLETLEGEFKEVEAALRNLRLE